MYQRCKSTQLTDYIDLKEDGLYWKANGRRVGCINHEGYRVFGFNGKQYKEHREVFFIVNGHYPDMIDHINMVKDDNRPENLRDFSNMLNQHNRINRGYKKTSSGKYEARISINGIRKTIGTFGCETAAHLAYMKVKKDILNGNYV